MSIISKPNTFSPNTIISSSEVNSNFDTLYNDYNGNISSANLATDAVTTAKIATSAVTADKIANGAVTSSKLANADGWNPDLPAPNTVTANGNRSYNLVFNSTDLTDTVSEGMRLRTTRTVSAPTQCADLNGSTQYFNDTSVAGTTFTDDFVAGAWVKLKSYGSATVVSRFNNTSGWLFLILADGTVSLTGYNASSSNFSRVASYQSIPLNKWVHITAQLDMSAFSVAGTTNSYVMIDGVAVPAQVTRGGTNPTALVQAGNLEVGSYNGGVAPFNGKLAQVFYSSAKITQANVQTLISQGLTPALISANSIVSAYSLSNDITDLNTTTANNLTAQGSALATNVDSPFGSYLGGTLDYGIITKTAFSTNTTLTVQVPEGCTIPTSGGVSAVAYSTQSVPYLFPRDTGRWEIVSFYNAAISGTTTANTYAQFTGGQLIVPIGSWGLSCIGSFIGTKSTSSQIDATVGISLSTSSIDNDLDLSGKYGVNDAFVARGTVSVSSGRNFLNATTYYLIGRIIQATISSHQAILVSIKAIPAYL